MTGRLLAEQGYHVILQDVRGRYASEGRFVPFEAERNDGHDTMSWLLKQPWAGGQPIGLLGASYLAYTAWCVLAEAPEHVGAVVSWIGSGDLYSTLYRGGAIAMHNVLEWGLTVGEQETLSARQVDLERGLAHTPVREADRVALRSVDWVRDWIDHPRKDAYWAALEAELPERIPPVLSMAGLYDFFLPSQMEQYDRLIVAHKKEGAVQPRLILGPWAHGVLELEHSPGPCCFVPPYCASGRPRGSSAAEVVAPIPPRIRINRRQGYGDCTCAMDSFGASTIHP